MNKEEINNNLNNKILIKGAGIGACFWCLLYDMPFLIANPNFQNFLLTFLPAAIMYEFYNSLKDQKALNADIIKKYKIKNYKNLIPSSIQSGLIGNGTLTFLYQTLSGNSKLFFGPLLISAVFLIPVIIDLKKNIKHNQQQIYKTR